MVGRFCVNHPDRAVYCVGLCKSCHNREWKKKNPDLHTAQKERDRKHWASRSVYRHAIYLKTHYSMTPEDELKLFSNGCEICGVRQRLMIDHDHVTGEVRGCLCRDCNLLVGRLGDRCDSLLLMKILSYFTKNADVKQNETQKELANAGL